MGGRPGWIGQQSHGVGLGESLRGGDAEASGRREQALPQADVLYSRDMEETRKISITLIFLTTYVYVISRFLLKIHFIKGVVCVKI